MGCKVYAYNLGLRAAARAGMVRVEAALLDVGQTVTQARNGDGHDYRDRPAEEGGCSSGGVDGTSGCVVTGGEEHHHFTSCYLPIEVLRHRER